MLDLKGTFPVVTAFIAFVITLLCLFAGTQKNVLENADLLTLYTPAGSSEATQNFYSVHVISYCQGTLGSAEPDAVGVSRNVTQCSNQTVLFAFDPADAWPEEITHGPTLEWPRVISDDFRAFRVTSQAMAVLYIIGVGATGFALIARASSFITRKTQTGLLEFGFLVLGALSLSIASIVATVRAFEFVALINAHGEGSNVSARYGETFLGMTWASAGLLLVGSISSFVNVFVRGYEAVAPVPKDEEGG